LDCTSIKKEHGDPFASCASILPVFAQKLTPCPSVDKMRHPAGNAVTYFQHRFGLAVELNVDVPTSNDARVDLGIAPTELDIFSSVVVHAGKL
jgi:hypothetical protein